MIKLSGFRYIFSFIWLSLGCAHASTSMSLSSSIENIKPGTLQIAVDFHIPQNAHMGDASGTGSFPTQLTWHLPAGVTLQKTTWPTAKTFTQSGITSKGYEGNIRVVCEFTVAEKVLPNALLKLAGEWSICDEKGCFIEKHTAALQFPTTQILKPVDVVQENLWMMCLLAILGGLVLNLMPCVFPVLALKVMDLSSQKSSPFMYLAGILTSFLALAITFIQAKSVGSSLGWGFQMQDPAFIFALCIFFLALSLNAFGVFEIPGFTPCSQSQTQKSKFYAFNMGALSVLVAAPCTAPFMGTAVSYGLASSNFTLILVLQCLGLGLALPIMLLSFIPGLHAKFPKPGPWMETLKHIFGFMLMASCLWLFWVLIDQIDAYDQPLVLSALFITAFLLWITGRFYTQKWVSMGALTLLIVVACAPYLLSDKKNDLWEAYDPVKLTHYREEGRPVFVDFTARWCLTCQVNKKMALERPNVLAAFKKNHVVLMRADWTNKSDQITKALEQLGQRGVPVSAFYPKNGQDVRILPTLLTPQIILSNLE